MCTPKKSGASQSFALPRVPNRHRACNLSRPYKALNNEIVLLDEFDIITENKHFEKLVNLFNLKSLISLPTCFQSSNPKCIDLIITNQKDLCNNSKMCSRSSDHHHDQVYTTLNKKKYLKAKARSY